MKELKKGITHMRVISHFPVFTRTVFQSVRVKFKYLNLTRTVSSNLYV